MTIDQPLNDLYAVIMAGGGGTRLWPLSRQSRPKQVLKLVNDRSLFNIAVDRLQGLLPPERIFVVTVKEQARDLMRLNQDIPAENYLIEPFPRGTASVVGLAAIVLKHLNENAVMAVLTADHYIEDVPAFQNALIAGYELSRHGYLVTMGIEPTFPSTGYGYIQRGEYLRDHQGLKTYRAEHFKEKPALRDAEKFVSQGDHDWNSGMFIWTVSAFWKRSRVRCRICIQYWKESRRNWTIKTGIRISLVFVGQNQTSNHRLWNHGKCRKCGRDPGRQPGLERCGRWDSLFETST